jgi:tyrosyl-tRNA synthetase
MRKSLNNYIGISDTADDVFGKIMSISDELMFRYYELLSDLSMEDVNQIRLDLEEGRLHPKAVKMSLATEMVARFHGEEAGYAAQRNFEQIFKRHELPENIAEKELTASDEPVWLPQLLLAAELVKSTSDGRRMIKQNAVSVNGEKEKSVDSVVPARGEVLLQVGKRRFCRIFFR